MANEWEAPELYKRKFGHYNIIWKIENFRLACCEENWRLVSPIIRIDGHFLTRWVLILSPKVKNDHRYAALSLRRLKADKGPDVVWVQWRSYLTLTVDNNEESEHYLKQYEHRFHKGEVFTGDHLLLKRLYFYLKPFKYDSFKIRCMFVFQPEYKDLPRAYVPFGLNSLSESLSKLLEKVSIEPGYDLELVTNSVNIRVHKAILYFRNKFLAQKIEKDCKDGKMDLSETEYGALRNLMYYLYTGNLESILKRPTIEIESLAMEYHIDEIRNCYILNSLSIESKYEIETFEILWRIPRFTTCGSMYRSSKVFQCSQNISWKLYMYPNTNGTEYVSICLVYIKGDKPRSLCIEFAVLKHRNECVGSKRKCKRLQTGIGFESFMKKDDLKAATINDALKIRVKIMTSLSGIWSSSEWYDNDLKPRAKIDPYVKLSTDLESMLNNGKFSDIVIESKDQIHKAHECILSARSTMLTDLKQDNKITVADMQSRVLQILLRYIYTGVLKDYESKDICTLYDHAVSYDIVDLRDICSSILRENLKLQSVVKILVFSYERKDRLLQESAMDFISQNRNEVFQDDSWKDFMETRPSLYHEVTSYMKNNIRKYYKMKKRFLSVLKRK